MIIMIIWVKCPDWWGTLALPVYRLIQQGSDPTSCTCQWILLAEHVKVPVWILPALHEHDPERASCTQQWSSMDPILSVVPNADPAWFWSNHLYPPMYQHGSHQPYPTMIQHGFDHIPCLWSSMDLTLSAAPDNDPAWIRPYQLHPTMIQHGSDLICYTQQWSSMDPIPPVAPSKSWRQQ